MEQFRPLHTNITEPHIDDAPSIGGGTLRMMHESGSLLRSTQLTNSNLNGLGHQRLLEQEAMAPHLGIKATHYAGHVLGIEDTIIEPDAARQEQVLGLMVQGQIRVYEFARKKKMPIRRDVSFGPDGMTGHWQHKMGYKVALHVASEFEEVEEFWVAGMSPDQREAFLDSYDRIYAANVPLVDTSEYKRIEIFRTLPHKIRAIEANKSQMPIDGERFIKRLHNEDPPVEYFRIYTRPELLELANAA